MRARLLLLAALLFGLLLPGTANAQYVQLYCDNGGGVAGGQLYYADQAGGQGACQYTGIQHVFSQVICNFMVILNSVIGKVYCGMQYSMTGIIGLLLSIYLMFFGVQLLMGTTQLNTKEIMSRLIKIGFVWVLATQSAWGIGLIFQFFMAMIGDGSWWVLKTVLPDAGTTADSVMPFYAYLDSLIYAIIIGPFTAANSELIGFFLAISLIIPPIFMMAVFWLWETVVMLARTLVNFLLAISVIAFLISMTPVFLGCFLFRPTYHHFEDWVNQMIALVFQIIIVFAIIALWIIVMFYFIDFFNQLLLMIFPYQKIWVPGPQYQIEDTWGICPPIYGNTVFGPTAACAPGFNPLVNPGDSDNLIPPSRLLFEQGFIYFLTYRFTALIMISHAFKILLQNAPTIARELAGSIQPGDMAAGFGMRSFGKAGANFKNALSDTRRVPGPTGGASGDFMSRIGDFLGNRDKA